MTEHSAGILAVGVSVQSMCARTELQELCSRATSTERTDSTTVTRAGPAAACQVQMRRAAVNASLRVTCIPKVSADLWLAPSLNPKRCVQAPTGPPL